MKRLVFSLWAVLLVFLIGCKAAGAGTILQLPETIQNSDATERGRDENDIIPQLPGTVQNNDITEGVITIVLYQTDELDTVYFFENAEGKELRVGRPGRSDQISGSMETLSSGNIYPGGNTITVPFSTSFRCSTEPIGKPFANMMIGCGKAAYSLDAQGIETVCFSVDGVRFSGHNVSYTLCIYSEMKVLELKGKGESELCVLRDGETLTLTAAHDCEVCLRELQSYEILLQKTQPALEPLKIEHMNSEE